MLGTGRKSDGLLDSDDDDEDESDEEDDEGDAPLLCLIFFSLFLSLIAGELGGGSLM